MDHKSNFDFEKMQAVFLQHIQEMAPGESLVGIEMVNLMRMNTHIIDAMLNQHPALAEISGPRMGILMRLMGEEDRGNHQGINPTRLSHYQNVKKNTVSSLISGLEEQGLVERTINPEDKRGFNIRLTKTGRDLITSTMPERIHLLNKLTAGLSEKEKSEMVSLLKKLRESLFKMRLESENITEPQNN